MVAYTKKPQQGKKGETERLRGERTIRSSLSILDLKDGKLQDSGKQEVKMFHKFHVLRINNDLRNRCEFGRLGWRASYTQSKNMRLDETCRVFYFTR